MRFQISHATSYTFSRPVFLEPHTLRLRPRCDATQRMIHTVLRIEPEPTGFSDAVDIDGNSVTYAWFDDLTDSLSIDVAFQVETLRSNPFDYLIETSAETLPLVHTDEATVRFSPYLRRDAMDDAVTKFANSVADQTNRRTQLFLTHLNATICGICKRVMREEGSPQAPEVTLIGGQGSCRDLAVLFIDACRSMGIPSRFVSGYHEGDPDAYVRYLHAWAEVYVPGGGWRAYDPSQGLAVADRHVAVAAGPCSFDAAPVTGTFRGSDVTSQMSFQIAIQTSSTLAALTSSQQMQAGKVTQ